MLFSFLLITGCQSSFASEQMIKAKEFDGVMNVSTLGRNQMFYYIENDELASSISQLDVNVSSEYYDFRFQIPDSQNILIIAQAKNYETEISNIVNWFTVEDGEFSSQICKTQKTFNKYSNIEEELIGEECY